MSQSETLAKAILEFAATRSDEAVFDPKAGYYPFSIVAEAYEKGLNHGVNQGVSQGQSIVIETIRKKYYNNATMIAESIKTVLAYLTDNHCAPSKLFINLSTEGGMILLSVNEKQYHSAEFSNFAYDAAAKTELEFHDKGLNLQIGFLNDNKADNYGLLQSDGYAISIDLTTFSKIY